MKHPATNLINPADLFSIVEKLYGKKLASTWRDGRAAVHLALMQGDFLESIIDGSKTIESRFSKARIAPVGAIRRNDLVLFKQVGKDRFAVGIVDRAQSGTLDKEVWRFVRKNADAIGIDQDYMQFKADARYYALVWMRNVHPINAIRLTKRDRRSWVILSARQSAPERG